MISEIGKLDLDDVLDTRESEERVAEHGSATEDYSLRRVPATWRWSAWGALWSFSGLSTAMAFPLTAGLLAMFYGGPATLIAFAMTLVYTWAGVYFFAKKASNEGALEVLMSKQSFGFIGSAYQLVAYGLLGALYFALEGHVMASSLSEVTGWSTAVSAGVICVAFIPLSIYGMKFISMFQGATIWLYLIGIVLVLYYIANNTNPDVAVANMGAAWYLVNPNKAPLDWVTVLSAFGAVAGVLGAIMILICTEQARFARRSESKKAAVLFAGLGITACDILTPILGVYLFAASGGKIPDPGVSITKLLGGLGLALIVLTQLRINVINVYFGTNALENFSSVVLKAKWSRFVYIAPFLVICYLLIVSPWLQKFGVIMTMLSVFLVNWANVMLGEFWLVRRRIGLPQWSEFRRGYLPSYNKIGLASMWIPTVIGIAMGSGYFGGVVAALAVPITGIAAFFLPAIIAQMMSTDGIVREYFARAPASVKSLSVMQLCPVEHATHHRTDFVLCPFHGNKFISSTACASEKNCGTMCHTPAYAPGKVAAPDAHPA
jgi:purine-cytosine permease-like protein